MYTGIYHELIRFSHSLLNLIQQDLEMLMHFQSKIRKLGIIYFCRDIKLGKKKL